MKNYILPDYSNSIDKIFLVSPINVRDEEGFINEFCLLIKLISNIIEHKIKIIICCKDLESEEKTKKYIKSIELNINSVEIEYFKIIVSDIWIRDYFSCGNIIQNKKLCSLKAIYNPSYNNYYSPIDDAAGIKLTQKYFDNYVFLPFKLDGGNIICNDEYIIISEKLYTENLNLSKKEIEGYFNQNFKQKLITIPTELLDVIGHTDSIVRFLDSRTLYLNIYDEDFRVDNRYAMQIRKLLQEKLGMKYKILMLPSYLSDEISEDNIFSAKGLFINFLRLENNLIIPSFKGLENYEREIKKILNKEFPSLNIYFSPCDNISSQGGCFNCITNIKYNY